MKTPLLLFATSLVLLSVFGNLMAQPLPTLPTKFAEGNASKDAPTPSGSMNYMPSSEDFPNPERGFLEQTNTHSNNYEPLVAADLVALRTLHQPWSATYSVFSTLVYRGFYLENFKNGPISNTYLNAMQQDFAAARQAGVKLNVRFAYTDDQSAGGCQFCPPYGDAPKNVVLQHIQQIKPILMANADVISVLEMGFIGIWGEGYYTDFFGDDSRPPYGLSAQNWNDRTEVLSALLAALPPDRCVSVRYPQMKQKAVYGAAAPTDSAPLTIAEAWQNTPKARIGFFNDCFLSSDSDVGTYINYDIVANDFDTINLKPYFAADSRFVPVGGETCDDWNPFSDCNGPSGGMAQKEMARMHFSYLNSGWNNALNNDWVTGNCIEEIKQRLGYRIELQTGEFSTEVQPGHTVSIKIGLKNKGFAAPFNPRKVVLILRHTATNAVWHVDLPDDPRKWLPGNQIHSVEHNICLPSDMPTGNYELLLHLADPYPLLANRPEYAIRLANDGLWESTTGFNRLLHMIAVNNTGNNPICAGETCFQPAILTIPKADFSANVQGGCAPLSVTYSNQSAACWDYQWTFPGGIPASSTEANPTVLYPTPGVFNVSLSVMNAAGTATKVEDGFIDISTLPTPDFYFTANGLDVSFFNNSMDAANYSWDFGDGTPLSTATNPMHHFTAPGSYNVTLSVSNPACGSISVSQQVLVSCPPLNVQMLPSNIINLTYGESVMLETNGGFSSWLWSTGETTSQIIVSQCGTYTVSVTDLMGCSAISSPVEIWVKPVVTLAGTVLMSSPATAYQWLLNGLPIPGASGQSFMPTISGDYSVRAECSDLGWVESDALFVGIVSTNELFGNQHLKIYPNPIPTATSELTIEMVGFENEPVEIVVVDLFGRTILRENLASCCDNIMLDVAGMPAGAYLLQVWQSGLRSCVLKLIRF